MQQLVPIPLINPALQGLNKAQEGNTTIGPQWALQANNCYFDTAQRLAARKGWTPQATGLIAGLPNIAQVTEFVQSNGSVQVVSAAGGKLYSGVSAYVDVTGTASGATDNWQFLNFYDTLIGLQAAATPIFWNGAGSFAPITAASGTLPKGSCGCAAFGRLWIADSDGHTIKYCALGDYTNWGNTGSGSIDMRSVWTDGMDTIVGIYAYFSRLVIFGQNHIIMYEDGSGSNIGLDPSTMVVVDTIEGTGLSARDTVQMVKDGDMLYLSPNGIQSLRRALVQKNNPVDTLDPHMRDYIVAFLGNEDLTKVRSVFSPDDKFYLLILPASDKVFCYDTLFPMEDGRLRITEWTYLNGGPQSAVFRRSGNGLLFGFPGVLGLYTGYQDDGNSYRYQWWSTWLSGYGFQQPQDIPLENRIKIPKRIGYVIYTASTITPAIMWGFDFAGLQYSATPTINGGEVPEYGTAEYGANGVYNIDISGLVAGVDVSEYSGQIVLNSGQAPGGGSGRWMQFGIECDVNGGLFAVQELDAYVKVGRMV